MMDPRVAWIRRLLDEEQLTVERLAIRAGWPVERVTEVLEDGDDAAALDRLLACFGLAPDGRPLSSLLELQDKVDGRAGTIEQRLAAGMHIAKVCTELAAQRPAAGTTLR
jgi:hypothetical protein